MNRRQKFITSTSSYYVETGLRHGYPLEELMWVVLSTKEIVDRELRLGVRRPVTLNDILKQQHDIMVERYKKKLNGTSTK